MDMYGHLLQHLAEFFLKWEIFQNKFVQKMKTHIFNNFFFLLFENRVFYDVI